MEKKCENCKFNHKVWTKPTPCCDCIDCKEFRPIVITNRQWLDSLSDENLAKEFDGHNTCCYCVYKGGKCTEHTEYDCKDCIHFLDNNRDKPQTNRKWLESLNDEEYGINIYQICIKLLQICLEKRADNEDCTIEHLIMDWLQAEHKE